MCTTEVLFSDALCGGDRDEWMNVIYEEVKSLIAHNTWRVVRKPPGARKISSRFVLRNKIGSDGQLERRKARLVAQGFS